METQTKTKVRVNLGVWFNENVRLTSDEQIGQHIYTITLPDDLPQSNKEVHLFILEWFKKNVFKDRRIDWHVESWEIIKSD